MDKLPFLAAVYACYYLTMTAPNPPALRQEISKNPRVDLVSDGTLIPALKAVKVFLLPIVACETIVIASAHFPSSVLANTALNLLVRNASTHTTPSITTPFLLGFLLALAGTYIRLCCYRAMGRHFTFEVSVRAEHKLITAFPYSVVRHPGYSSLIPSLTGVTLCLLSPGSWIVECGWLELLVVKVVAGAVTGFHVYIVYLVLARMDTEEKMMRREFGREWEEWARNVPWKLVPGVF